MMGLFSEFSPDSWDHLPRDPDARGPHSKCLNTRHKSSSQTVE